jgi:membrane associated rhomboid family serine protease
MPSFRTGSPSFPPVVKILLIINGIVYFAQKTIPGLTEWGALHYWGSPLFKPHQLITHLFMHDPDSFFHILFNMLTLWMFGSILETYWGAKRFLNFYLICGLGAALVQMAMIPFEIRQSLGPIPPDVPIDQLNAFIQQRVDVYSLIGASGAIMGLMAAFAYLFPNTELYLFFIPMPVKAKYVIPVYVLIDLFGGFNRQAGDNVGHFAHLGGAAIGIILVMIWNKTNRRNFY